MLHWPLVPMMVMTLVGCSTGSLPMAVAVAEIEDPVVVLPEAPALPHDPHDPDEPCLWPTGKDGEQGRDYHCDVETRPQPGDIINSRSRWSAIKKHLDRWNEYPWKCAGAIDDCHLGWRDRIVSLAKVEVAKRLKAQLEEKKPGWPLGSYLAIIGGGAAGLVIGVVIGFAAGL